MDDTRNVSEDGQDDVDEEVRIASTFEEDTDRRQEDGKDDLRSVNQVCLR